ncbi:MAG: tetratricopeptide repeat protein [Saprospiraceae bacterium]|nr:tetratricopeptide repeat protein [Saprospiraceae bacterium]
MKDNTRIAQTLLITAACAAVFVLYFFGKTVPKPKQVTVTETVEDHSDHNHSSTANTNDWQIEAEASLSADDMEQLKQLKSNNFSGIAAFWANRKRHDIAAIFKNKFAEAQSDFRNWDTSGDAAIVAFRADPQDSVKATFFINQALQAYSNALILEDNITTKLKLAKVQTEITGQTMEGVVLLREIVDADPNHIQANYELGALSIRSGQWEKAIQRFTTVIKADPNLIDAYVLKAQSLIQLEQRDEALATLRTALENTGSPEVIDAINEMVNNIEKN